MRYGMGVIALAVLITPAFADAIFTLGNHPQPLGGQGSLRAKLCIPFSLKSAPRAHPKLKHA
jgi:hypothetical protein